MGDSPKSPLPPADSSGDTPSSDSGAEALVAAVAACVERLRPAEFGVAQPLQLGVALSGGCDSVVLLHALVRLRAEAVSRFELSAIHVHHGLSPHAEKWADFCRQLCAEWLVPLQVRRVEVVRDSGEGLEGAARRVRHAAFAAFPADWLALAQHRGDQAETVLLNVLRGAGVLGAAAMPERRRGLLGPGLVRPLLGVPQAVLRAYAADHGLHWIEDESNADTTFRRNFLRHTVLPQLSASFPGAEAALARAAAQFGEAAELLEQLAAQDLTALRGTSGRIQLARFNALSATRARNVLRFVWQQAGFRPPDRRWVDEALAQLATVRPESETCVATPDGALHVYRGELYLVPALLPPPLEVIWAGEEILPWGGGRVRFIPVAQGGIALQGEPLVLRCRQGGERLRPAVGRPRRSLRNLLQEIGIPPWERVQLPCLWIGDELAWVGGVGMDAAFAGGPGVLPIWERWAD